MSDINSRQVIEWRRPKRLPRREAWAAKFSKPPKKPCTPYFLYLQDQLRRYNRRFRRKLRDRRAIIDQMRQDWPGSPYRWYYKTLANEQRQHYLADMAKWKQQFAHMKRKPRIIHKRGRRADRPKMPLNSFFVFKEEVEPELARQKPDLRGPDRARELGRMWKALPAQQKLQFKVRSERIRNGYRNQLNAYRNERRRLLAEQSFDKKTLRLALLRERYPKQLRKQPQLTAETQPIEVNVDERSSHQQEVGA